MVILDVVDQNQKCFAQIGQALIPLDGSGKALPKKLSQQNGNPIEIRIRSTAGTPYRCIGAAVSELQAVGRPELSVIAELPK
jgi:hypothetical protein